MQIGSMVYNLYPDGTLPMDVPLEIERIETSNVANTVFDVIEGKKQAITKMMPATWFIIKGFPGKHRKYQFETGENWKYLKELEEAKLAEADEKANDEFYSTVKGVR